MMTSRDCTSDARSSASRNLMSDSKRMVHVSGREGSRRRNYPDDKDQLTAGPVQTYRNYAILCAG